MRILHAAKERLERVVGVAKVRLAPAAKTARQRLSPTVAAAKERLAPVAERLAPAVERVREAAAEFGEIMVGSAPDTEVVRDPVGDIRAFLDIEDTEVGEADVSALEAGDGETEGVGSVDVGDLVTVVQRHRVRGRHMVGRSADDDAELTVPPGESWSLSMLEQR